MEQLSVNKSFGGQQFRFSHRSQTLNCTMTFAIYLPPQANLGAVPVLYWLSGLTCTDENFVIKAGAQQYAAEYGLAIVVPDTSPRGDDINGEPVPDDPQGNYDFGYGAGFYLNATQQPWARNYRMYDYITEELPELINQRFPVDSTRTSIFVHSMGGHGAITVGLKNPGRYRSISAFSPICHPMDCPWGEKALVNYLGDDRSTWSEYDSVELMKNAQIQLPMLVDQGLADNFLAEQLKPETLAAAADETQYPLTLRQHEGYDHSYFFISSFIEDHLRFHAKFLKG